MGFSGCQAGEKEAQEVAWPGLLGLLMDEDRFPKEKMSFRWLDYYETDSSVILEGVEAFLQNWYEQNSRLPEEYVVKHPNAGRSFAFDTSSLPDELKLLYGIQKRNPNLPIGVDQGIHPPRSTEDGCLIAEGLAVRKGDEGDDWELSVCISCEWQKMSTTCAALCASWCLDSLFTHTVEFLRAKPVFLCRSELLVFQSQELEGRTAFWSDETVQYAFGEKGFYYLRRSNWILKR